MAWSNEMGKFEEPQEGEKEIIKESTLQPIEFTGDIPNPLITLQRLEYLCRCAEERLKDNPSNIQTHNALIKATEVAANVLGLTRAQIGNDQVLEAEIYHVKRRLVQVVHDKLSPLIPDKLSEEELMELEEDIYGKLEKEGL